MISSGQVLGCCMFEFNGDELLSLLMSRKTSISSSAAIEEPLDPAAIEWILHRSCSLWGGEWQHLYISMTDRAASGVPGNWGISDCSACGIARPDPQPVAEDTPKQYPSGYYTHHATAKTRFDRVHQASSRCVLARRGCLAKRAEGQPPLLSRTRASARAAVLEVISLSTPKSEPHSRLEAKTAGSCYEYGPWTGAKVTPDFFQLLEDALVRLKADAGEKDFSLVRYAVNS